MGRQTFQVGTEHVLHVFSKRYSFQFEEGENSRLEKNMRRQVFYPDIGADYGLGGRSGSKPGLTFLCRLWSWLCLMAQADIRVRPSRFLNITLPG